jgi:hypothetical protein
MSQNPTSAATEQLLVQLPAGTKCSGGANKDLCLASFETTAGFGNCVAVSQGAGPGVTRSTDKRDPKAAKKAKGKKAKGKKAKGKKAKGKKAKGKQAAKAQGNAQAAPAAAPATGKRSCK